MPLLLKKERSVLFVRACGIRAGAPPRPARARRVIRPRGLRGGQTALHGPGGRTRTKAGMGDRVARICKVFAEDLDLESVAGAAGTREIRQIVFYWIQ